VVSRATSVEAQPKSRDEAQAHRWRAWRDDFNRRDTTALENRCQAKFLTWEISDFTPCAHAQSNIARTKYAEKTDY